MNSREANKISFPSNTLIEFPILYAVESQSREMIHEKELTEQVSFRNTTIYNPLWKV